MNEPLWQLLAPCQAATIRLPAFGAQARRRLAERVRKLPADSAVVLLDPAPFSNLRCRRFAAMAGLEIQCQYLAFPALRSARYLVEDAPESLGYFGSHILTVPPGGEARSALLALLLRLATRLVHCQVVRGMAMGRVALGRRR